MNMTLKRLLLVALLVGSLTACASVTRDIRVETEAAPNADLGKYRTFAWLGSAEIVNDPQGNWEPPDLDADAEIRFLLNRELRNRGMREVASNPELVVAFAAGVNTDVFRIVENPQSKLYTLENAPKAALVVVFIDARTHYPLWVGTAVGEVKAGRTTKEVRKRIEYAVRRMLNEAPP